MKKIDEDLEYEKFLYELTPGEAEDLQTRRDVFAAQIRVGLGWIDLEVRP